MACSLIPSEIRLRIFEFCPDVPTAASLAQISKPFNDTWMSYKESICSYIFITKVECCDEARNLVLETEELSLIKSSIGMEIPCTLEYFAPRMLAVVKAAERAYNTVIHDISLFGSVDWTQRRSWLPKIPVVDGVVCFNPNERERFFTAWYTIQTISAKLQHGVLPGKECLPHVSMDEELFLLLEVVRTVCIEAKRETSEQIGRKYPEHALWCGEALEPRLIDFLSPESHQYPWDAAFHALQKTVELSTVYDLDDIPGLSWRLRVLLDDHQGELEY
ncbi:MAG: hypothetical protein Q9176_001406 [Flavoplaca citrina]